MSGCFCFEDATGDGGGIDATYWKSFNLRQSLVAEYSTVRRTARQTAHEISLFKRMKEREIGMQLSMKQLRSHFGSSLCRAPGVRVVRMATVQVPAMVEAMFLGLARGAASRHVVAAAVVAVMRSSVASDGGPGFVDRLQAVGREMLAREAVGAIVGAPFSHAPPARRFLVQTDLGAAEE
jgi:hypothetical protein